MHTRPFLRRRSTLLLPLTVALLLGALAMAPREGTLSAAPADDSAAPAAPAWLTALKKELRQLAHSLRCHFAEEQEGPIYRTMPVQFPRYAERLESADAIQGRALAAAAGGGRR